MTHQRMFRLFVIFYGFMSVIAFSIVVLWINPEKQWLNFFVVDWRSLITSLAVASIMIIVSALATHHLSFMKVMVQFFYLVFKDFSKTQCLLIALLSGVGEELLFRGVFLHYFGIHITTIAFAALHIGPDVKFLTWTVFALIVGYFFGFMVLEYHSIMPAIIAHAIINFINLLAIQKKGRRL